MPATSSHSFVACPLYSDPGAVNEAPFADAPASDNRFFGSMCSSADSFSRGCPPPALRGGSNFGCAPGREEGCWGPSADMTCSFGAPPGAPAIWTTTPGLAPLHAGATR